MKRKITEACTKLETYLSSDVISFSLLKSILLPIFWEQLFLACLSLFSIWLLSFDGESAMSVVNMMSVVNKVFTSLCLGLVTGGTVLVAQNIGAKRDSGAGQSMVQTMSFAVLLTTVLGIILLVIRHNLVGFFLAGAGDEIMSGGGLYFTGFCVSLPFYAFYQSFAGAMRGWGKTNIAWRLTLSVNCIELGLIAILLTGLKTGVSGVMLAMLASRISGAVYAAALMIKNRKELGLRSVTYLRPSPVILKSMLIIAVPLALEQFFFNSGKAVSQKFIAGYGVSHMAANGVINAVFDFINLPQITFRETLVTIVGMCVGCGRGDLAKRYVYRFIRVIRKLIFYLMPVTVPLSALLVYSYRLSSESVWLTVFCLALIYIMSPPLLAGSFAIPAGLRAGGDAAFVSVTALACMWGVRVTLSYLFAGVMGLGVVGINLAMVVEWFVRNMFYRARLKGELWYSRRLIVAD